MANVQTNKVRNLTPKPTQVAEVEKPVEETKVEAKPKTQPSWANKATHLFAKLSPSELSKMEAEAREFDATSEESLTKFVETYERWLKMGEELFGTKSSLVKQVRRLAPRYVPKRRVESWAMELDRRVRLAKLMAGGESK